MDLKAESPAVEDKKRHADGEESGPIQKTKKIKKEATDDDSLAQPTQDHAETAEDESNNEIEEHGNRTKIDLSKEYKKYVNSPKFNLNSEEVFCICRKPDHGGLLMISCDGCDEWFHFKCMKLNSQHQNLISKFYCRFCEWKDVGHTLWKRKCRSSTCFEPIAVEGGSKYCSQACGIKYISSKISKSGETKSILLHIQGDDKEDEYRKLVQFGLKFPQLSEVSEYLDSGSKDASNFPVTIQTEIRDVDEKSAKISQLLREYKTKLEYLTKTKDKIKVINENLESSQREVDEETTTTKKKGSKGKLKKIDICGYEKTLNFEHTKWVDFYNEYKTENNNSGLDGEISDMVSFYREMIASEDANPWFEDRVCMKDKRKCLRHGGWWLLINDEISKNVAQFNSDLKNLDTERQKILRAYSIKIFEQTV